jgi:hypothetical protein
VANPFVAGRVFKRQRRLTQRGRCHLGGGPGFGHFVDGHAVFDGVVGDEDGLTGVRRDEAYTENAAGCALRRS